MSLHFDVNRTLAVSYFRFLKSMSFLPVVNLHHGLAALLGFNSDTNIYNYCYLFAWLIIVKFCFVLYYQVRLDNGVSMHKLVAWSTRSKLMLTAKTNDSWVYILITQPMTACVQYGYIVTGMKNILEVFWLGHRTMSYHAANILETSKLRIHSKIKQRSHDFIKTLAEQNCMAKKQWK